MPAKVAKAAAAAEPPSAPSATPHSETQSKLLAMMKQKGLSSGLAELLKAAKQQAPPASAVATSVQAKASVKAKPKAAAPAKAAGAAALTEARPTVPAKSAAASATVPASPPTVPGKASAKVAAGKAKAELPQQPRVANDMTPTKKSGEREEQPEPRKRLSAKTPDDALAGLPVGELFSTLQGCGLSIDMIHEILMNQLGSPHSSSSKGASSLAASSGSSGARSDTASVASDTAVPADETQGYDIDAAMSAFGMQDQADESIHGENLDSAALDEEDEDEEEAMEEEAEVTEALDAADALAVQDALAALTATFQQVYGADVGSDHKAEDEPASKKMRRADLNMAALNLASGSQGQAKPGDSVPAEQGSEKANSASHNVEWKRFDRWSKNKKAFPVALGPHLKKDKTNLFQQWLDCKGDGQKLVLQLERGAKRETEGKTVYAWKKMRHSGYPEEKQKVLGKQFDDMGSFRNDPHFPTDEEERFYWLLDESSFASSDKAWETSTVRGDLNVDNPEDLIGEGAIFEQGITSAVPFMDENASMGFLKTLGEGIPQKEAKRLKDKEKKDKEKECCVQMRVSHISMELHLPDMFT